MKKIFLFLLSTPFVISMEQEPNKRPITPLSLYNEGLVKYIQAIENGHTIHAARLAEVYNIDINHALLYAYQHKKQHAAMKLLPRATKTSASLMYLIKTNQLDTAFKLVSNKDTHNTIDYFAQDSNGTSLLDLIVKTKHAPLLCACTSYTSSLVVRHLARRLIGELCSDSNNTEEK